MYHQVEELPDRASPFRYLNVAPVNFLRQMQWLKRAGWTGLSVRNLRPYLKGERTGKVVGITFDDGFRNVYENALPVLNEFGFTATTYFVTSQVGGFNDWDTGMGAARTACMSKQEVRDWVSHGHEAGSHTLDHVHLSAVEPSEARRQIFDSRHVLEDMTGEAVESFAYPYGDVSPDVRSMVADCGYALGTTTRRGRARPQDDMLLLPRRIVRSRDNWFNVLFKCAAG